MSPLGQERSYAPQNPTSGLPPRPDIDQQCMGRHEEDGCCSSVEVVVLGKTRRPAPLLVPRSPPYLRAR
jgi:hypothetical protein